jgi:hypothetical protein
MPSNAMQRLPRILHKRSGLPVSVHPAPSRGTMEANSYLLCFVCSLPQRIGLTAVNAIPTFLKHWWISYSHTDSNVTVTKSSKITLFQVTITTNWQALTHSLSVTYMVGHQRARSLLCHCIVSIPWLQTILVYYRATQKCRFLSTSMWELLPTLVSSSWYTRICVCEQAGAHWNWNHPVYKEVYDDGWQFLPIIRGKWR